MKMFEFVHAICWWWELLACDMSERRFLFAKSKYVVLVGRANFLILC